MPGWARRLAGATSLTLIALAGLGAATPTSAASGDPEFVFEPQPSPPPAEPEPPPTGYLNGPCGLAVDSSGHFYVADHYHDRVDVFNPFAGYVTQLSLPGSAARPCALALDSGGDLYVGGYHGAVVKYSPSAYPPTASTTYAFQGEVDAGPSTGVAVDPASGWLYVDRRDSVAVYDSAGAHLTDVGLGMLGDAYGAAISSYVGTAGYLYVADAADDTVKVFDAAGSPRAPIAGPPGGFASLREASVAVDPQSGDVYVLDDTQPQHTEQPLGLVDVFDSGGAYKGHLRDAVVDGAPSGLAVVEAGQPGRVYVTSGNTHAAAVYAYPPGAAVSAAPQAPQIRRHRWGERRSFRPRRSAPRRVPPGESSARATPARACRPSRSTRR